MLLLLLLILSVSSTAVHSVPHAVPHVVEHVAPHVVEHPVEHVVPHPEEKPPPAPIIIIQPAPVIHHPVIIPAPIPPPYHPQQPKPIPGGNVENSNTTHEYINCTNTSNTNGPNCNKSNTTIDWVIVGIITIVISTMGLALMCALCYVGLNRGKYEIKDMESIKTMDEVNERSRLLGSDQQSNFSNENMMTDQGETHYLDNNQYFSEPVQQSGLFDNDYRKNRWAE